MATDSKGRPLELKLTPGQSHEATVALELVTDLQGNACIADTAYDSQALREKVAEQGKLAVIPSHPKRTVKYPFDRKAYRVRYRIECFFHSLKRYRRVATRYEKRATHYLAMVHVACIVLWLV